ncbi:MAG: polysaccharide deacetylase family protein [Acidobacteria bacterium]|nr:polysaccharide deacetylase family protein [Acidobacteriota bacterium]
MLEMLEHHGAPATFFQCGANVERLPGVARDVGRAGHEIGNHSHTHPLLCFHSPGSIEEEFRRAQETIAATTGFSPALMRAPYGARWFGFRRMQRRLGLIGVMWTIIGYDWKLDAVSIANRIARRTGNGAIICLHDGRELQARPDIGETIKAVGLLVPMLRDRGFSFETVTQLLCPTI